MMKNYHSDYNFHDAIYKRLKEEGASGWGNDDIEETLRIMIDFVDNALDLAKIQNDAKFLELGCGAANLSMHYAKKGFDIYGIDISKTAIEWAKEKFDSENIKGNFFHGNVVDLLFDEDFFDVIIDAHCLHCIIDDDRKIFLNKINQVLKKNGIFVVMTMCGDPKDPAVQKDFDPKSRNLIKNGVAGRYFGKKEDILDEVIEANFEILEYKVELTDNIAYQDELILFCKKK